MNPTPRRRKQRLVSYKNDTQRERSFIVIALCVTDALGDIQYPKKTPCEQKPPERGERRASGRGRVGQSM